VANLVRPRRSRSDTHATDNYAGTVCGRPIDGWIVVDEGKPSCLVCRRLLDERTYN
jgi:hypothetical protein